MFRGTYLVTAVIHVIINHCGCIIAILHYDSICNMLCVAHAEQIVS